jgi:hypothetical protein
MADAPPSNRRIATYADFWPHYLQEHTRPATRRLHFLGTAAAVLSLTIAATAERPWFIAVAAVAGYGPAWLGHVLFERNQPTTFTYPFWSLISDFRMAGLWLIGQLGEELDKAGVHR